jgi:hypothetical protein
VYVKRSWSVVVLPCTVTCTEPVPDGAVALIDVDELNVHALAVTPPKRTLDGHAPAVNPLPVMVIGVPGGPELGEMLVTAGPVVK